MNQALRDAFGDALVELKDNEKVVVLDADLSHATKTIKFRKACPERHINMGISEQDMIATAAGLATCGMIPFTATFSIFAAGRAYEQVRNSVAYPKLNVKMVGTHAGVTAGPDGGSHQAIEDLALMRTIPNMTVLCPSDDVETRAAVLLAAEHQGPVYIRVSRMGAKTMHTPEYQLQIGKGEMMRDGTDVAIIATGLMVERAVAAAELLGAENINAMVINMCSIKPMDEALVLEAARKTGRIVTAEEHSVCGGLGSAVSELLAKNLPTPMRMIGVQDRFGQSGTPEELLEEYGLTAKHIAAAAKSF